jgi:hypothetical protein
LRSQGQVSSSPFSDGTALAGRDATPTLPEHGPPSRSQSTDPQLNESADPQRGWSADPQKSWRTDPSAVRARRRRRRLPGGHMTEAGRGGRLAPFSTDTDSHTHTACSIACPLLTLSSAHQFSNGIFRLSPPHVLLPHTYTQDGWFLQPEHRPALLPRRTLFSRCICRCSRMRARLSPPRVLLPHTYTQDRWFLQPERRPALLPCRTLFSRCICRCSRMCVSLPLHILLLKDHPTSSYH